MDHAAIKREYIFNQLLPMIEDVSSLAAEILASDEFNGSEHHVRLVDLGVSSIDYVEILNRFMDLYKIDLPIEYFPNVNKISDVVDLIYQLLVGVDN